MTAPMTPEQLAQIRDLHPLCGDECHVLQLLAEVARLRAQVAAVEALADLVSDAGWTTVYETGSEIAGAIRAALSSGGDQ